jgi:DNA-binding NtrC family response regulator
MQIVDPRKSILILDDEFDIVSVLKQGIDKQGFRVFGFTDPYLALEHFQINSELYGLVITDLRMPGMNGYEFIKKVKEIKPQVKVFFMTAFSINDVSENYIHVEKGTLHKESLWIPKYSFMTLKADILKVTVAHN